MAQSHLPKPSLRSPAVAEEQYPSGNQTSCLGRFLTHARMLRNHRRSADNWTAAGVLESRTTSVLIARSIVAHCVLLFSTPWQVFSSESALEFFQSTLKSPPHIEYFAASSQTLRQRIPANFVPKNVTNVTPPVQFYEGARAGGNFFLRDESSPHGLIVGRTGTKAYNVLSNAVYFGFEGFEAKNPATSDRISQSSESMFRLTAQFCQLGLGDLNPESVVWTGSEFVGMNLAGRTQYGRLELSNGLPWKLTLRWQKEDRPFKMITYLYSSNVGDLYGYPSKAIISALFDKELHPFLELAYKSVQVAQHPLPPEFFEPAKFITGGVLYTNIWGRKSLTSISPKGSVTVPLSSVLRGNEPAKSRRRIVCAVIMAVFLVPLGCYFFLKRGPKPKQETNYEKTAQ